MSTGIKRQHKDERQGGRCRIFGKKKNNMSEKPLQLLIVKKDDDTILAQKFFKRKRKVEKLRFEFTGGSIKAVVASYVPLENSLVLFLEQVPKG